MIRCTADSFFRSLTDQRKEKSKLPIERQKRKEKKILIDRTKHGNYFTMLVGEEEVSRIFHVLYYLK